eukprot:4602946-Alexandrium_andersonii.AAC.1
MPSFASCRSWGARSPRSPIARSGDRLPGRLPHPALGATRAAVAGLGVALPRGVPRRGLRPPRKKSPSGARCGSTWCPRRSG